jgi:hypothetical protein
MVRKCSKRVFYFVSSFPVSCRSRNRKARWAEVLQDSIRRDHDRYMGREFRYLVSMILLQKTRFLVHINGAVRF